MKVDVYNQNGKKTDGKIELNPAIFEAKVNMDLMTQAVYTYQTNQRQGTKKTKSRAEVRGGGRKPWAQKTPDRARHGSRRSPIWVGGGHAHAISPKSWKIRLPKNMRRAAIFSALSAKLAEGEMKVVDMITLKRSSLTKQVSDIGERLSDGKKVLIIQGEMNKDLVFGAKQLPKIGITMSTELNVYEILSYDEIILLQDAVEKIHEIWGKKAVGAVAPVPAQKKKAVAKKAKKAVAKKKKANPSAGSGSKTKKSKSKKA